MRKLTPVQSSIHERAVKISTKYLCAERGLIDVLADVERTRLHRNFDCPSLFRYAVDVLGLSEGISYALISIARKSREVPQLKTLSVSKANRIVSIINKENAAELIRFAKSHTQKEIEFEVARRNPKAASRDRLKPISEDLVEMTNTVSKDFLTKLKRAQSLEAQKGHSARIADVLEAVVDKYLFHEDPVAKAARAAAKSELCVRRVEPKKPNHSKRIKLSAEQKHTVFQRDGGRCTHVNEKGERCDSDRWIEVHHIRPVSMGGGNEPENLTTLCSFHHDLVHQLSFPVDGQVSWLRERTVPYG